MFCEGIKIVDAGKLKIAGAQQFSAGTIAAFRLIQSLDPRRFRRLQRHIKVIMPDMDQWGSGSYQAAVQCCSIKYSNLENAKYPEWQTWRYAAVLVHEATHGAIHARYIPYTPTLRVRIERLCHAEEKRFAIKADNHERQWADAMVGTFDERRWHEIWNSNLFSRMKRRFTRKRG